MAYVSRRLAAAVLIGVALPVSLASAQVDQNGLANDPLISKAEKGALIDTVDLPAIDVEALLREDARRNAGDGPMRFADRFEIQLKATERGLIEDAEEQGMIAWRLRLRSPNAVSINFAARMNLPEGVELYLLAPDGTTPYRAITSADNAHHGEFWSPMILGDTMDLYAKVPEDRFDDFVRNFEVFSVQQGYRGFGANIEGDRGAERSGARSAACHIDVACDEADPWRDQVDAVGVYTIFGSFTCSGSMINNTARDGTPYFYTADHCGIRSNNDQSVVVYWNYQNSFCRPPGSSQSGGPGNGSLSQFSSGVIFRMTYSPADSTLVELEETPPASYGITYNGWNRSGGQFTGVVGIHHPGTEEKRISIENGTTFRTSGGDLYQVSYDQGYIEGGSSGSPLFDPAGRTLGAACCVNFFPSDCDGQVTWYGTITNAWNGGGSSSSRLRDWLDPLGTNAVAISRLGAVAPGSFNLVAPFNGTSGVLLEDTTFQWQSATDVQEYVLQIDDDPGFGSPDVEVGPMAATTTSTDVDLSGLNPLTAYRWRVIASNDIGETISNPGSYGFSTFIAAPTSFGLTSPSNFATDVSPTLTFTWDDAAGEDSYRLQVSTSTLFLNNPVDATVGADQTQYTVPAGNLNENTLYFWRVTAVNAAGNTLGTPSALRFTTGEVTPACPADFNGDGTVDGADFGTFGAAFGSSAGDADFNPDADFNNDGTIDGADFGTFGAQFGSSGC